MKFCIDGSKINDAFNVSELEYADNFLVGCLARPISEISHSARGHAANWHRTGNVRKYHRVQTLGTCQTSEQAESKVKYDMIKEISTFVYDGYICANKRVAETDIPITQSFITNRMRPPGLHPKL